MTNWRQNKSGQSNNRLKPFVCHKLPNVADTYRSEVPFVGSKFPIIGSGRKTPALDQGFTLVELMIAVVIGAILLGIAVPNLRSFIQNGRIVTQSNDLIGSIAVARSEAIKRNKSMVICRSNSPVGTQTCANDGTNSWQTGWLIFQDANGDNLYTAGTDTLISIHEPLTGNDTLRGNVSQLYNYIAFTNTGATTLSPPAAGTAANHFKLCDQRGASKARAILIDPTGHARAETNSTFTSLACP